MTDDTFRVSIVGLPGSGKTTLLAALWHAMRENEGAQTALTFGGQKTANYEHLNALARRWRQGKIQARTQTSGMKTVSMTLEDARRRTVEVTFPDVPGEDFSRMWEDRELDETIAATLEAKAIVLLVNGDKIRLPAWVVEHLALAKAMGLPPANVEPVEWTPDLAPTQVQIVDLLQLLMTDELDVGPRRLAILISAWDKVEDEQLTPLELLRIKLPLLAQYLTNGRDPWTWRVWGLSAQGGVYEDPEKEESFAETDQLRDLPRASDRVKVVDGSETISDITAPIAWLVGG